MPAGTQWMNKTQLMGSPTVQEAEEEEEMAK